MSNDSSAAHGMDQGTLAGKEAAPMWALVLWAVAMALTASQTRLPVAGGILGLGDVAIGLGFAALLFLTWQRGWRVPFPLPVGVLVLAYCAAALLARSGRDGGIESVQRVEQFFGALLVFSVLLLHRRRWLVIALGIGLGVNVIVALAQGAGEFGPSVRGLFHSRMALSFYLAAALVFLQPFLYAKREGAGRQVACVALTVAVLFCIAHGQMLLLAVLALTLIGLLHSRRAALLNLAAVCVFALLAGFGRETPRSRELLTTLSPFRNGRARQEHAELIAAMRMAGENPWSGIGAGKYQSFIGTFYRDLPNPNVNEIERDTQSGLGILFGTTGIGVGLLFVLVMLAGLCRGLERFYLSKKADPLYLGGAGALGVLLIGSLISDPMVLGVGWLPPLALASVFWMAPAEEKDPLVCMLGWTRMLAWGAAYALLALLTIALGEGTAVRQVGSVRRVATPPRAVAATVTGEDATGASTAIADMDFFRVIDAADAKEMTEPVIRVSDSQAGQQTVLYIPEGKGKPPDDAEPEMKYGGAVFELDVPKPVRCRVWVRTWWSGSCGNSIFLQIGEDTKPIVVGQDGTYKVWHWLPVPLPADFELPQGKCRITLLNREDGIRFDQILVTGDLQYVPQGIEEE